jgi:hypothetical protein
MAMASMQRKVYVVMVQRTRVTSEQHARQAGGGVAHCVRASSRHTRSWGCSRLLRDWCGGCSSSGLRTEKPPRQVKSELLGGQDGAGVGRVAGSNQLLVKASALQGQIEWHSRCRGTAGRMQRQGVCTHR